MSESVEAALRSFEEAWRRDVVCRREAQEAAVVFGVKLRRLRTTHRTERKLSRLAEELRVSPKSIMDLEEGRSRDLTLAWRLLGILEIGEPYVSGPEFPDPWCEDDRFTFDDWKQEVCNGETQQGYVTWVFSKREQREDELAESDEFDREQPGDPDGELTASEYDELLRYGNREGTRSSPLPGDFLREEDGVWFWSGGRQCVGGNGFHLWHSGTDAIYAAGSCIAGNHKVPLEVLKQALALFEDIQKDDDLLRESQEAVAAGRTYGPKTRVHLNYMVDLCRAAIQAVPDPRRQNMEGEFEECS